MSTKRSLWLAVLCASAFSMSVMAVVGCGDDDDEEGTSAENGGGSGSEGNFDTDLDLVALAHLADVDRDGLFIDFGTPAQAKYTVGDWAGSGDPGWGSRGNEGDLTFANAGRRGRLYFHLDEPSARFVTLHLKPVGTRAITPYINNEQIQSIFFEGDDWQDVTFQIPSEHTRAGENYLLFSFGGVETVGGEDVSVRIASARLTEGESAPSSEAPAYGTYTSSVELGGNARESLVTHGGMSLTWYAEIPENGSLSLALGQEGEGGGTARIFVRPEGGSRTKVHEARTNNTWQSARVNLSEYAGQVVQLTFVGEGGSGRFAWANAAIQYPAVTLPEAEPAKNVVVVLVDTLRASKLHPWNGESRVRTPVLDALAQESVVFEHGQSSENWTKPAVGAILTGLHPMDHGARTQSAVLSDSVTMVSEHFKSNGFATGGFIANGYISDRFGFDQGWDRYKNFIRESGASSEARDVFQEAGDWALEHRDERFFLYVHTIDPHVPYDPEEEFVSMYDSRSNYEGQVRPRMTGELLANAKGNNPSVVFSPSDVRRLEALHDGEITQHDRHMGAFIDRLKESGLWEDTVFVFVSDHGEEFNEHGSWGHGHSIYQELLHVPFLIHREGLNPRRVGAAVGTIDIPSTLTEMAGIPAMNGVASRSLLPLMHGQQRPGPEVAMSEFLDERRVMITSHWKFFVRGNLRHNMFDLREDPSESNQLDVTDNPIAARYLRTLQGQFLGASDRANWLDAEQRAGQRHRAGEVQMDSELQQQLRELGYLN